VAIAVGFLGFAARAELPPDVLAKNRWTQLTRADYDAALKRIPEKSRFEFATSPKRVQDLLNTLLLTKTLSAQAKAHGTHAPTEFGQQRGPLPDSDRALADAELKRIESEANKSFDASKPAFEAKALELYKANPENYKTPEEVRISDIAVLIEGRGDEAARVRANEARTKVTGGADFATIAREYSDDPTSRDKGGALPLTDLKRLAPDYAKGVARLTRIGEVSEPIKGRAAYHVVRLEERRSPLVKSFGDVHESIMDGLRKRYVAEQRDVRIQEIFRDAGTESNQPAIDALVNRVDPEVLRPKRSGSARSPRPQ
jgi:hypothetical protein